MKFICGPSPAERDRARREAWKKKKAHLESLHEWFAWHPVRVGPRDCRWLETVVRLGRFYPADYDYDIPHYWSWTYFPRSAFP